MMGRRNYMYSECLGADVFQKVRLEVLPQNISQAESGLEVVSKMSDWKCQPEGCVEFNKEGS